METFESNKYNCTPDTLKSTLETYGVAVIPSVLDEYECESMYQGFWNYFTHISRDWDKPIKRNDTTTWKEMYRLIPQHGMLLQHFEIGHAQHIWNIRQNPNVVEPFAKLWKCDKRDLLVSFDGAGFGMAPELTGRGWFRKSWFHTDQSFTRNDFECVQSWVTALDVKQGDASLAFYEGSHKYHKEFASVFKKNDKRDWCKLNDEEEQFFVEKGCAIKRISCPKGSMVFWDSRTLHHGSEPLKGRTGLRNRAVAYVCYQPRKHATKKQIDKKQKAFANRRTCSHWPTKTKLFGKHPQTYGKPLPPVRPLSEPTLSDLGRRLAGF